jgi:hypothetical protein
MTWINVDDQLPENNTLCWAYIPNKGIILRLYSCDAFGLGDEDYAITYWMEFRKKPNLNRKDLEHILLSILPTQDHISADFLR